MIAAFDNPIVIVIAAFFVIGFLAFTFLVALIKGIRGTATRSRQ